MNASLRSRLMARERLLGTFIKTPAHQTIEIAGSCGLDFVVIDCEHAPFSADVLDRCLLAAAAAAIPALVRVPSANSVAIQQALDMGSAGILVPHVSSSEVAESVVAASRFRGGRRGYSNSPRAGAYGALDMEAYMMAADEDVAVIVQIEDRQGVENAHSIASVPGIDAVFIGRADLAVDHGVLRTDDPAIKGAVVAVGEAASRTGTACGIFVSDGSEVDLQFEQGMSFFIIGSDQSALRRGWALSLQGGRPRATPHA